MAARSLSETPVGAGGLLRRLLHRGEELVERRVAVRVDEHLPVLRERLLDRGRARDPGGGARGVVLAQAGRFGGWSLYFQDGGPT
jgi:hypothetical protein